MIALATLALVAALGDSVKPSLDSTRRHKHRISAEAGYGYETSMWRIGTQHDFRKRRLGTSLVGQVFIEATAGVWHGQARAGDNRDIVDLGVTPVWQLLHDRGGALTPYVEAAVGFHHISETRLNSRVGLGTKFQFGDHAGVGLLLGKDHRYDLTFRFQHLSNGGVRAPNHGVNFSSLRFAVRL